MKNERLIRTLTERFFQGETTLTEEQQLYRLYRDATLPDDLQPYRQLFLDMAALSPAVAEVQPLHRRSALRRGVRWLVVASLAVTVVAGGYRLFSRQEQNECVAYIYGQETTDPDVVMAEMQRAAYAMTAAEPMDNVDRQLNEMFKQK